jgi:hypothetical protein
VSSDYLPVVASSADREYKPTYLSKQHLIPKIKPFPTLKGLNINTKNFTTDYHNPEGVE